MRLRDKQVRALLLASRETHADEIDCEQFLALLAQFAEMRAEGREVTGALAKAKEHERLCANCREESAALVEMVRIGS